MSTSKQQLGQRVRQARREMKISQGALAQQLGVTQTVISNVETGVSAIDVPDLPKWAETLNKPLMYFYSGHEMDVAQRVLASLTMIPEDQLDLFVSLIENMALTFQHKTELTE
jgi:transcriptional regulator with XRE-family HTH domain